MQAVPVLYNKLGGLSPPDLLRLLTAFSTAAQHSPSAYSQELYAALTEFLWESLAQLQPGDLADIAAAYAAVEHYDDDEDFFDGLAAAAVQKIEVGPESGLARLPLAVLCQVGCVASLSYQRATACVAQCLYSCVSTDSTHQRLRRKGYQ